MKRSLRYDAVIALGKIGELKALPVLKQIAAFDEGKVSMFQDNTTVAEGAEEAIKTLTKNLLPHSYKKG